MNRARPSIYYDRESGVLSIEVKKAKSVDSDIQGNAVIDYDRRGDIVRVNLYRLDFSAFRKAKRAMKRFARVA